MKKTLIALAVLASAGSVNAAQIVKSDEGTVNFYGQIREHVEYTHSNDESASKVESGSSRAGINASWALTDDLNLIGKAEFGLTGDISGRKNYIGVSNATYGALYFGKNALLADDVYGAEYSWLFGKADRFLYDTDLANDDFWQENSVNYDLIKDNYFVRAQYNLDEKDDAPKQASVFAGTSVGDLALHSGVVYFEDRTGTNVTNSTSTEVTAEYTIDTLTLGATYAHMDREVNDTDDNSNAYNLGFMYGFAKDFSAYGGYQYLDRSDVDNADEQNSYLGVQYRPVTWALTYVEYGYNDTEGQDSLNSIGVGARVYW